MEGKAISIEPNDVRAVACSAHGKAEFERLSRHLHPTSRSPARCACWACDAYRELLGTAAEANGWYYQDLWNTIRPEEFTHSPVHLTPVGSAQLAERVGAAVLEMASR